MATRPEPAWGTGPEGERIADLGDGTYRNPVLSGDFPDPTVLRDGADYYLTTSSFDASPGLLIHHSRDLVNWTPLTFALPRPLATVFAVDLIKHDGRYFIYIPFIPSPWAPEFGTVTRIFVIHADHITGPWSEPVDLGITNAIDPGHVVGEDGKRYLFLNGVRRVRLTDDGLATDGPVEHVYDGWRYPNDWVTEAYALEGPKLFRRSDWFYLVSAVGGTAGPPTGHMVTVARSRSVHGPWENDPANPIVRTRHTEEAWWSRGHATAVEGPGEGNWWLVYHGYENGFRTLGRQVLLEPAEWTDDGWLRAAGGDLSSPIRKPADIHRGRPGMARSDRLIGPALGPQWTFYAPARDEASRVRFTDQALRLTGKGTDPSDASPITVPSGDRAYEVEVTLLDVEPGAHGGLLLFFNRMLFLGMQWDGAAMITYSGGHRSHFRESVPPSDALHLRIRNDHHIVSFFYSTDGVEWTRHGLRFETSGYHANTMSDLLSLRPAIYAAGTGAVTFSGFRYRALR